MEHKVLLVEENEQLNLANRRMLEIYGYTVLTATTAEAAREVIRQENPDLLILDILLPGMSGLEFCQELRQHSDVPILFLSGLGETEDIVKGLEAGGDAYLAKPYDYDVLLAKIKALLRRAHHEQAPGIKSIGPYTFNHSSLQVFKDGVDMMLVPKEFGLFRILAENVNHYISPETLYREVWGREANGDIRTIYPHFSRLRHKLKLPEGMEIQQKRGVGYRLSYVE